MIENKELLENQRFCPICNKILTYTDKYGRNRAEKKGQKCSLCAGKIFGENHSGEKGTFFGRKHSPEVCEQIRKRTSGRKLIGEELEVSRKNIKIAKQKQMEKWGGDIYLMWVDRYGKEIADQKKEELRKKQSINSKGENNPMYGKPAPKNSGGGWKCWYRDIHFRSIRELIYFIQEIENKNLQFRSGQTADLKIKYIDDKGSNRTYVADFLISEKYLIEIKPKALWNTRTVQLKKEAAEKFCKDKCLEYKIVDVTPDSSFLLKKYLSGDIEIEEKYREKFEKFAKIKICNKSNNDKIISFFDKYKFINLCGNARSGKNTLQDVLSEIASDNGFNTKKISLAKKLKDNLYKPFLDLYGIDSHTEDSEKKSLIRPMLVACGNLHRELTQGTYFTSKLTPIIKKNNNQIKILSDLRYVDDYPEDEYVWAKKNGGFVIYLERVHPDGKTIIGPANDHEEKNNKKLKQLADLVICWETTSDIKSLKSFIIKELEKYVSNS